LNYEDEESCEIVFKSSIKFIRFHIIYEIGRFIFTTFCRWIEAFSDIAEVILNVNSYRHDRGLATYSKIITSDPSKSKKESVKQDIDTFFNDLGICGEFYCSANFWGAGK
jgi:hypothetical protein